MPTTYQASAGEAAVIGRGIIGEAGRSNSPQGNTAKPASPCRPNPLLTHGLPSPGNVVSVEPPATPWGHDDSPITPQSSLLLVSSPTLTTGPLPPLPFEQSCNSITDSGASGSPQRLNNPTDAGIISYEHRYLVAAEGVSAPAKPVPAKRRDAARRSKNDGDDVSALKRICSSQVASPSRRFSKDCRNTMGTMIEPSEYLQSLVAGSPYSAASLQSPMKTAEYVSAMFRSPAQDTPLAVESTASTCASDGSTFRTSYVVSEASVGAGSSRRGTRRSSRDGRPLVPASPNLLEKGLDCEGVTNCSPAPSPCTASVGSAVSTCASDGSTFRKSFDSSDFDSKVVAGSTKPNQVGPRRTSCSSRVAQRQSEGQLRSTNEDCIRDVNVQTKNEKVKNRAPRGAPKDRNPRNVNSQGFTSKEQNDSAATRGNRPSLAPLPVSPAVSRRNRWSPGPSQELGFPNGAEKGEFPAACRATRFPMFGQAGDGETGFGATLGRSATQVLAEAVIELKTENTPCDDDALNVTFGRETLSCVHNDGDVLQNKSNIAGSVESLSSIFAGSNGMDLSTRVAPDRPNVGSKFSSFLGKGIRLPLSKDWGDDAEASRLEWRPAAAELQAQSILGSSTADPRKLCLWYVPYCVAAAAYSFMVALLVGKTEFLTLFIPLMPSLALCHLVRVERWERALSAVVDSCALQEVQKQMQVLESTVNTRSGIFLTSLSAVLEAFRSSPRGEGMLRGFLRTNHYLRVLGISFVLASILGVVRAVRAAIGVEDPLFTTWVSAEVAGAILAVTLLIFGGCSHLDAGPPRTVAADQRVQALEEAFNSMIEVVTPLLKGCSHSPESASVCIFSIRLLTKDGRLHPGTLEVIFGDSPSISAVCPQAGFSMTFQGVNAVAPTDFRSGSANTPALVATFDKTQGRQKDNCADAVAAATPLSGFNDNSSILWSGAAKFGGGFLHTNFRGRGFPMAPDDEPTLATFSDEGEGGKIPSFGNGSQWHQPAGLGADRSSLSHLACVFTMRTERDACISVIRSSGLLRGRRGPDMV